MQKRKREVHRRFGRRLLAWVLVLLFLTPAHRVQAEENSLNLSSKSVILMEESTGQVIYEQNSTEQLSPASITKIMTLLLTFEAISQGNAALTDQVIVSEYASSMGGSQVYLAQGEQQTLETMIKCIVVSSGNDASVAVAEHIAGSEEAFVQKMNDKAAALGMVDTHFEDCCGLTESDNHYTTARDVAIMSRELSYYYPEVLNYSGIWMENIVHDTPRGREVFGLSSTNKLLKQYPYATGLKTGFTSKAMFCLSATATKDGIDLIAVIMGAPDSKTRFSEAQVLLNHGFALCKLYVDSNQDVLPQIAIEQGKEDVVELQYQGEYRYLDIKGSDLSQVTKQLELPQVVEAPVQEGEVAGMARYYLGDVSIGGVPILYGATVERSGYWDCFMDILELFLL
ncbi:MAG: D-alanyl-D-alanine carboxypeptidase [Lachnospiraceae bacterium]|nr:D-alanyl-D-alanine carboxypeptidase [Lachnospiraceae bacterium]